MAKDLEQMTTEELGRLFPVMIVGYDPAWPILFHSEKKKLTSTLGKKSLSRIEHIGSTAIPGLCAKPTIDMILEIKESTPANLLVEKLRKLKYQHIPKPENPPPHMMFVKGYTRKGFKGQAFHLHIRYPGDWDEIIFRDYLLANPQAAAEYAALKMSLASVHRYDREKYTEGKTSYVRNALKIAGKDHRGAQTDSR